MDKSIKAKLDNYLPSQWCRYYCRGYTETELNSTTQEYRNLHISMSNFATKIRRVTRVECPYLYGWFLLKQAEYGARETPVRIRQLYHDTAEHKISSILTSNLDWRLVQRHKFGQGVSFSPDSSYANRQSSMANGTQRAMIIADVLIGYTEDGDGSVTLPRSNHDTTTGNHGNVYVKFYNEFCPRYVIYYDSIEHVRRKRTFYF